MTSVSPPLPSDDGSAETETKRTTGVRIATPVNTILIAIVALYAVAHALDDGLRLEPGRVWTQVRDLLVFAFLCGFASFATIEVLKRVAGLRGIYQRRQVASWLEAHSDRRSEGNAYAELLHAMDLDEDTSWFEALRRGGRQDVFNLPIELLAAQISAAAEYALSKPEAYPALASALDPGSLEAAAADRDDADRLRATGEPSADTAPSHSRDQDEERNFRVAQRVRASIDRLQISIGQGWRQSIQGAAVWLAGAYGIGLERLGLGRIALAQPTGPYTLPRNTQPAYVFAALILGGVIAWTIRDVLATLERSRR